MNSSIIFLLLLPRILSKILTKNGILIFLICVNNLVVRVLV